MEVSMRKKHPKIFAAFAFRYDAELNPDLLKNISGIIDGYVSYDDRENKSTWYHEGKIRNLLIKKARAAGADWILCIDPDERFEIGAAKKIRKLVDTHSNQNVVISFPFRELWTPKQYRIDGVWGEKRKRILFPLKKDQRFMNLKVHSQWHPVNDNYSEIHTDINLYHLKNIDPENRTARKDLYNSLDKDKKIQPMGYDYLDDETGIKLQTVSYSRRYKPTYSSKYLIKQLG